MTSFESISREDCDKLLYSTVINVTGGCTLTERDSYYLYSYINNVD